MIRTCGLLKNHSCCISDGLRYVDYPNITKVIEPGRVIYVDDGVLAFEVLKITDDKTLHCKCINNGRISSRKGVNCNSTSPLVH